MLKKTLKGGFAPPALSTLSQFELLSVLGGPGAQAVRDCCRGRHGVVGVSGMGKKSRALGVIPGTLSPGGNPRHSDQSLVGAGPGGILAALRYMSSSLSHEVPWGAQGSLWPSPGKLMRRVLS